MTASVRSVAQAFAILRLLAETSPLSLSDIGRALGLSPSSGLNLLRTLVDEGVIERDARGKRYRLTPEWAAADLFRAGRARHVIDSLRPAMVRFARRHATTCGLWKVVPGNRLRLIAHAQSDAPMRIQLADGQRQPLGGGAVGRALAAAQGLDDAALTALFAGLRWQQPVSLARYVAEVGEARERGFAMDDGAAFAGVCSVAVALPEPFAEFAVSASVFSGALTPVEVTALGRELADMGAELRG
ncbi:MAG: helix-turn-helix domain-containing protein [Sphingomonadales bacterium]|nr:helix-turn-helix domain-containing protein [Sphingomonadales bacterium]